MDQAKDATHVVAIVGGAVAGSEAAVLLAESGALAVVFEQNARPYGKIEDGLPRWHAKLREREYARINANLDRGGVMYVPNTAVGRDVSFETLHRELAFSSIILATGAWRDRPLPVPGADSYVGSGLLYQNALVGWFNHYHEANYDGPAYEVHGPAIVVGGGLASIDVVKIINLQLYQRALAARGIEVDLLKLEHRGIAAFLQECGVTAEELNVDGATLYYRRSRQEMPLATPRGTSAEELEKVRNTRARVIELVMRKFLVKLEENCVPVGAIDTDGRLGGLVFRRTQQQGSKLVEVAGSDFEVRAPLTVGSIGSLPQTIPGVPSSGDLYTFADERRGQVAGVSRVFALGNVLTGKGNIKDSRVNAADVADHIIGNLLGVSDRDGQEAMMSDDLHEEFRAKAEPVVQQALADSAPLDSGKLAKLLEWVKARQQVVGYSGYQPWIEQTNS